MSRYLLAVDTATETTAICLLRDGRLAGAAALQGRHHSRQLIAQVDALLKHSGVTLEALAALGVGLGPGSFTGVRIGVTFIKTLAAARRLPVVGVSTLEVLAEPVVGSVHTTVAVINAYRGLVYAAAYRPGEGGPQMVLAPQALTPAQLAQRLQALPPPLELVGDGALLYAPRLIVEVAGAVIPPQLERHRLSAEALGRLCAERFGRGEFLDAHRLEPLYLRQADAELTRS